MLHLALLHEYNMVLSIFLPVFQFMSFLWRHYNITLYLQFHNFPLFYIFGRDISFVLFVISLFLLLLGVLSSVFFSRFLVFSFDMQIVLVLSIYPILYLLSILLKIHIVFC